MFLFTEEQIIKVAKEVINSLKKRIEYINFYYAWEANRIPDEEFDIIAEKYTVDEKDEITKELVDKIKVYLLYFNDGDFVPSDISNLFGITIEIAEKILEYLYKQNYFNERKE